MNTSNVTQVINYCKYWNLKTDVGVAAKTASLLVLGIFAMLCNVFIIVLATKYTVRRNLHFLIINMAVSDTFVLITPFLYTAQNLLVFNLTQFLGNCGWMTFFFLDNTSRNVSLFTLVIISIERYRIIRQRVVQLSRPYLVKQRLCLICCIWCLSAVLNMNHLIIDGNCHKIDRYYRKIWVYILKGL